VGNHGELRFCGQHLRAVYQLRGGAEEAAARAAAICIEQTVEFPEDLISRDDIREQVFGKVASCEPISDELHRVEIDFAVEIVGRELTQLLNVLFGNISLMPDIRLVDVRLPTEILGHFDGPRFGREGLRARIGAHGRPLMGTALKPMGLGAEELADMAHRMALGEVDLIKDDHGLADQAFCPFRERVERCAEAVARANEKTGRVCLYLPNVSAPAGELEERARFARKAGAGGLLISPGLCGLDSMRRLACDAAIDLPILSHPSLQGSFTVGAHAGISHGLMYGLFNRLAGADGAIFPNFGGRFSFSEAQCREIAEATARPLGDLAPIFPVPAGGMTMDRIDEMRHFYGADVIVLIGGDRHRGRA
jgi:ribulose-bisphosphate carboxylase large chain